MCVAMAHVAGGILLYANTPESWVNGYLQKLMTALNASESDPESLRLILRLFGATVASWGVLMCYLVRRIRKSRDRAALDTLLLATFVWFVLDTSLSLQQGVMIHLGINSLALLAIWLPGLFIRQALGPTAP